MLRYLPVIAATALVAQPLLAGPPQMNPKNMRQISEVMFKNYPPRALLAGEQGPVYFVVTLDKDAHPTSCQVTHGSGYPLLDQETCDLIVQHAVFNSAKDANGRVRAGVHEGVVNWTIPGQTPAPINPIPLTAETAPEKQVCRNTQRVGSLAGVQRTCMTQSEWARQTDQTRQTWRQIQGQGYTNCVPGGVVASGIQHDPTLGGTASDC